MSDYDVYELSERERQVVFTALDLYREAAEKQQEANEKKVRVHSEEIAELLETLIGDDYRIGLLHKFMAREARERIAKERAERERRDREARAQMGLFSDGGGQTVEEALEGVEAEAGQRLAQAEASSEEVLIVPPADVEDALKAALDGIDRYLPTELVHIGGEGPEAIYETRIAPVTDDELERILKTLWAGTIEAGAPISFKAFRTANGYPTWIFVAGGDRDPGFYYPVNRNTFRLDGPGRTPPTLSRWALLEAVRRIWGIPRPEAGADEPETTAPTTGADDAFAELVSALKGDSRPITDFAELLSPTLIAILRDHGITTVGHVAERWDELPGITGVGKVSLGRLRTLLQEASSAATAGAAASAGETDEDGDLPF